MSRVSILFVLSLVLIAFGQDTTSKQYDLNSQIIINTQRLSDLERRMKQVEEGGSQVDNITASRTAVNEIHIAALAENQRQINAIIAGAAVVIITNLIGLVWLLLKPRLVPEDKAAVNRYLRS